MRQILFLNGIKILKNIIPNIFHETKTLHVKYCKQASMQTQKSQEIYKNSYKKISGGGGQI